VKNATITAGDKLDLVSLITVAKDSKGKDATSAVLVDRGVFDANTPGEYTITFTLKVDGFEDLVKTATVKVIAKQGGQQPTDSQKPEASGQTDNEPNDKGNLPNTATNQYNSLLFGFIIVAVGGAMWLVRKHQVY
jgi:LPXTG-motif cell wall-anchored protein